MAQIIGTLRDDHLTGTSVINSPTGADDIFGLAGNDRIDGRSGNDRLFGGPGDDQLLGNVGDDLLFGEDDDDLLRGGPGADQLFGGNGRDVLLGDDSDDLLAGDSGDDDLLGGAGADRLQGGNGDDNLLGDAGEDVLDGGPGNNRLSGDAGADRFILADFDVDEILDLNLADGDVVDFSALAQQSLSAGLSLGEAVRLDPGPFGATLSVDVGDSNGFQDVALLRGAEPVVEVTSTGELVALDRPVAVPLVLLPLPTLDGSNGFRLDGIDPGDLSGSSVGGAGDVNRDGFADVIVGAIGAAPGGLEQAGESYVVFGNPSGFGGALDLAALDGSNGFRLDGIDPGDVSGFSVSGAGDVNGDGLADVIVGAPFADPGGQILAGESYVVFGDPGGFDGALDLATLDGGNGFRLDGIDGSSEISGTPGDVSGWSVSGAGDVNGDGLADVIVGTFGGGFAGEPDSRRPGGESYVVFGDPGGFGGALDLENLDGTSGFRLDGVDFGDASGRSVSDAGDVNGDGFADLIVAASRADPGGEDNAGESYVVFGGPGGFGGALDLATLDGSNGFRLEGIDAYDYSGWSVSGAGDVNGDGFADVIVGAPIADPGGDDSAGESYVVFGDPGGFGGALDLAALDGSNGFRLDGIDPGDRSGWSVSGAGDINGDGFADVVVGAYRGDSLAGESYVVFGDPGGFGGSLDLGALDGTTGFRFPVINSGDRLGTAVSGAGDVNGDGFADLVLGALGAESDAASTYFAGESYVMFGDNFTGAVDGLGDDRAATFIGSSDGEIFIGGRGDDALIGSGGADLLNGAAGDDLLAIGDVRFRKLLGGSGTDTVRLDGTGDSLDLTAISDLFFQDIERVDLNGNGNRLVLNTREILNIDDNSNALTVLGGATNAVRGDLTGATVGQTTVGGVDFTTFAVGQAQLLVQTGVDTSAIETAAA